MRNSRSGPMIGGLGPGRDDLGATTRRRAASVRRGAFFSGLHPECAEFHGRAGGRDAAEHAAGGVNQCGHGTSPGVEASERLLDAERGQAGDVDGVGQSGDVDAGSGGIGLLAIALRPDRAGQIGRAHV
jgi:hypothetical protein